MKIKDIFAKSIDRDIKGVITIGDEQDQNVRQELEEYVVTRELQKHFQNFFNAYIQSINHDTNKMGVWISGFFGSGKSHFLKILAYLLENKEVAGKPALNYFLDDQKIQDQKTIDAMQLATSVHNDTILFNIDSKAKNGSKSQKDAILNVFWQVFNEKQGLIGADFWIADLERDLIRDGQYDAFQKKFQELDRKGRSWLETRNSFAFLKGTIKETLVAIGYMTEADATGFIEQWKKEYPLSVEDFAKRVNEYIEGQSEEDYHLIFLVDEVGQYIGDSQQRMLNLQSVVEDLGTYTNGKAWVIVTSQQAIDQVTDHINGQDFSKIQGRFNTRIAMSSANVDEVIDRRLLAKNEESQQKLELLYQSNQHAINNLITFESEIERDHYRSPENFADVYPFIPYQFNLLQDTLTAIRENGSDGKHLANGERSMLAIFQESAQRLENKDIHTLVPYSLFYQGLDQFLDHTHLIVIQRALDNDLINPEHEENPFAVQILETLFMVKYVNNFDATINNITTLMIDSIEPDRINLEKKVQEALNILVGQGLVEKTTKGYEFLTDAEQDISRQVLKQNVDSNEISQVIGEYLFTKGGINSKFVYPKLNKQYTFAFNQFVDEHPYGPVNRDMSIRINTPESDTNGDDPELRRLALSPENPQIIIDMPSDGAYLENFRQAARIKKFVMGPGGRPADARAEKIIDVKRMERTTLVDNAQEMLVDALQEATIYVGNDRLDPSSKKFEQRLVDAQVHLIDDVYRNLNFIKVIKNENDIKALFRNNMELVETEENAQAVQAVMDWITSESASHGRIAFKSVFDRFETAPYGYREIDIRWLVARLFVDTKLKVYVNGEQISLDQKNSDDKMANNFIQKKLVDKIQIEPRIAVPKQKREDLLEVAEVVFHKKKFENMEDANLVIELRNEKIEKLLSTLNVYSNEPNYYPGKDILGQGESLLKSLLNRHDTDEFYNFLSAKRDDLLDWAEDYEDSGLEEFYGSASQKEIWEKAYNSYEIFQNSKDFIDSDETKNIAEQISLILKSNKPQGKINELKVINESFISSYNKLSDVVEDDVVKFINDYRESLINYAKGQKLGNQFSDKINQLFEGYVQDARSARDLKDLNILNVKIPKANDKITTEIDQEVARLETKRQIEADRLRREKEEKEQRDNEKEQDINDLETVAKTDPTPIPEVKVPVVKHINLDSLSIVRTWHLEDESDVDRQLEELRQKLMKQLKDADQVNLDL